jgi:hypothetical protein
LPSIELAAATVLARALVQRRRFYSTGEETRKCAPPTEARPLFARSGRKRNAVAMGADLALDYFAGAQGISCLAGYELSAIIAVRTFLLPHVLVLHD